MAEITTSLQINGLADMAEIVAIQSQIKAQEVEVVGLQAYNAQNPEGGQYEEITFVAAANRINELAAKLHAIAERIRSEEAVELVL